MLYLSEVRAQASKDEPTFDGKNYQRSGLGRTDAPGIKGYNGIEKTFKAYSPTSGSKAQISFITGYSGDINGTKAKYHVQVSLLNQLPLFMMLHLIRKEMSEMIQI